VDLSHGVSGRAVKKGVCENFFFKLVGGAECWVVALKRGGLGVR
jgi:hypothetical protein